MLTQNLLKTLTSTIMSLGKHNKIKGFLITMRNDRISPLKKYEILRMQASLRIK